MKSIYLTVVIPAYNEQESIASGALKSVYDYLSKQKYRWEVLVVDDGSKDKTVELAERFATNHKGFRILKEPHRGKGGTVIAGMLKARGEIVLFSDMDQATPLNQVEKFIPRFSTRNGGADVVIGSRTGREGAPLIRKAMAYGFSLLRFLILGITYKDTQCGFKAFKRDSVKKIFKRMKIFSQMSKAKGASVSAGFDLEILYIARKLGLKVSEVSVTWRHQKSERVNPIKDSWEGLRDLLRIRLNDLGGKYKI